MSHGASTLCLVARIAHRSKDILLLVVVVVVVAKKTYRYTNAPLIREAVDTTSSARKQPLLSNATVCQ
jgi:hypothetical protein